MRLGLVSYVAVLTVAFIGLTANADTVVRSIQAPENDSEEFLNTPANGALEPEGTVIPSVSGLGSTDLELGSEGGAGLNWQVIAMQWDQLGVPQGSTIDSAHITFTVDDTGNPGDNNFTILAENVDNSSEFDDVDFDISTRARTAASVPWAPPETNTEGETIDTPNIAALVQEVVDRAGWSEDNMLSVMIYPDAYLALPDPSTGGTTAVQENEFEAFEDNDGAGAATLTVEFSLGPNLNLNIEGATFAEEAGSLELSANEDMLPPYQWKLDGADMGGETGSTLSLSPTSTGDSGVYTLDFDDGTKAIISSNPVSVSIFPAGSLPVGSLLGLGLLAVTSALAGGTVLLRMKK